jgi:outer membrane lipopolysaccharide assembly protein LptE/RlpB
MTAKLTTLAAVALASALAATGPAYAFGQQTIDANQDVLAERIEEARANGELTRKEYRALKAEQVRIAEMERQAKADGHVSVREFNKIHDAQIGAYRHVKQESTDGEVSFWRRWLYRHRN